jgi:hypothetical protein
MYTYLTGDNQLTEQLIDNNNQYEYGENLLGPSQYQAGVSSYDLELNLPNDRNDLEQNVGNRVQGQVVAMQISQNDFQARLIVAAHIFYDGVIAGMLIAPIVFKLSR